MLMNLIFGNQQYAETIMEGDVRKRKSNNKYRAMKEMRSIIKVTSINMEVEK